MEKDLQVKRNNLLGRSATKEEAESLISRMEEQAEIAPYIELTPENWTAQFGKDGEVDTPIGKVKMGENQFEKIRLKKREKEFGMILPTLTDPDVIIEKESPLQKAERNTKYLFVKTFVKTDGGRYIHFESVTILNGGKEVSISSHEAEFEVIKKEMQNGKILHLNQGLSFSSEKYLTKTPKEEGSDLVPTPGNLDAKVTYLLEEKQAEWGKDDLFYTLALTLVPGFGLKRQHDILKRFESAQAFFEAATRQRKLCLDADDALTQAQRRAEAELETAARNGWHTCPLNSPDYPPLLRDCPDAPLLLFVRSQQPPTSPDHVLKRPALGIVGTRNASLYGLSQTDRLVAELQDDPICTVSGLALGIDAQAHRSSLDYGLPTIAVVGHGLDMIYPAANEPLAQEIIDKGGAVITEMPSGIQITGGLFPRRNRIIAGLSQAVVVAEASIKGGALITARIAHSYNRSLFAFPGKNDMTFSKGCNFLIKTQMAQLLETADDLRAEVAWTWGEPAGPGPKTAKPSPRASAPPAHLDDAQRALLRIIQRENPADIEQLTAETGRPLPDLLSDLLTLELSGCIRTVPGNRYEAV